MPNDLFKRAKAYVKAHPRTSWQDAIKKVAKKKPATKRRAAVGKAKKVTKVIVKARTAKVGKVKKKSSNPLKVVAKALGIGGVALGNISSSQKKIQAHNSQIDKLKNALKVKGMSMAEKKQNRAVIKKYGDLIRAEKALISANKRHL